MESQSEYRQDTKHDAVVARGGLNIFLSTENKGRYTFCLFVGGGGGGGAIYIFLQI